MLRGAVHSKTIKIERSEKVDEIINKNERGDKREVPLYAKTLNKNAQTSMELNKIIKAQSSLKKSGPTPNEIQINNILKNSINLYDNAGMNPKEKISAKRVVFQEGQKDGQCNPNTKVIPSQSNPTTKQAFKSQNQIPKVNLMINDGRVIKTQQESNINENEKNDNKSILKPKIEHGKNDLSELISKTVESEQNEKLQTIPGDESSCYMKYDLNMSLEHTNKIIEVVDNIRNVLNLTLKDHLDSGSNINISDGSGNDTSLHSSSTFHNTFPSNTGKELNFLNNPLSLSSPGDINLKDMKLVLDKKLKLNIISQEIDIVNTKARKFEESMSNILKVLDLKSCIETAHLTKEQIQEKTLLNIKEINIESDQRMFVYKNFFMECAANFDEITDFIYKSADKTENDRKILSNKKGASKTAERNEKFEKSEILEKSENDISTLNNHTNNSSIKNLNHMFTNSKPPIDTTTNISLFKRDDIKDKFKTVKALDKIVIHSPKKKLKKSSNNKNSSYRDSNISNIPGIPNSPYKTNSKPIEFSLSGSCANSGKYSGKYRSSFLTKGSREGFSDDDCDIIPADERNESMLLKEDTKVIIPGSQIGAVKKNVEANVPFKVVNIEYADPNHNLNSVEELNDNFNQKFSNISSRYSLEDTIFEFGTASRNSNIEGFHRKGKRSRSLKLNNTMLDNEFKKAR